MKRHYFFILVAVFLLTAYNVTGNDNSTLSDGKKSVQNIFVRYDAGLDDLILSDTESGPESRSHDHLRVVSKGDIIQWHWKGAHQNLDFLSADPKDEDRNPFGEIKSAGEILSVVIRNDPDFPAGDYGYSLAVTINGSERQFDPSLQIH